MSRLVNPHGGGPLKPLLLEQAALTEERERIQSLLKIPVASREKGDLIMLGIGGVIYLAGGLVLMARVLQRRAAT